MSDSAPSVPDWLLALIAKARAVDGQPPFSDQSLVELRTGIRTLLADGHSSAALLSLGEQEAEFVVDPDARDNGRGRAMLERLLSAAPGLKVWAHGDHPAARSLAASHGLVATRELLHLTAPVEAALVEPPLVEPVETHPVDPHPSTITLDTFHSGVDNDAWVALNARIFATHPEQGRVTLADLAELMAEPWFSAEDFLVARSDNELAGYCWLKVEGDLAEFYVVGVAPEHQGEGLGRRLVNAGLSRMRELGIRRSHLYVEGDNAAALTLYRSLGFADDTIDVQYTAAEHSER